MTAYSKIRVHRTRKSLSIDFSEIFSPPQSPKPITNPNIDLNLKTQQTKKSKKKNINTPHDSTPDKEEHDGGGEERFGEDLRRNCSVSSTSSQWIRAERRSSTSVRCAVRRAFSVRKSSTLSDGYCRIHDQCGLLSSPTHDHVPDPDHEHEHEHDHDLTTMQTRSKKKRGKIIKACQRLFGR